MEEFRTSLRDIHTGEKIKTTPLSFIIRALVKALIDFPIFNSSLDIEGLLLTMFDSRLRLSNQVVEEVQKHFDEMVFDTIIQRNVRLSEAPSYGESIINYDAGSKGAANYLSLAQEIITKNDA